jgi:hypothetical protein
MHMHTKNLYIMKKITSQNEINQSEFLWVIKNSHIINQIIYAGLEIKDPITAAHIYNNLLYIHVTYLEWGRK